MGEGEAWEEKRKGRCRPTARKVARRRKLKKKVGGREKDGNCHRCAAEVGEKVEERGYDSALPRVMQTTFYLLEKPARGGGGQINNTLKSLLQEIVVLFNGGFLWLLVILLPYS